AWVRLSLPGSPDQSVHFVSAATSCAALMASHSLADTTATRLPLQTTVAPGKSFLSTWPTAINVEPNVAGRTMRACNIPCKATSQLQRVLPVTLSGMPGTGNEVPMSLNALIGFKGGSPPTV